jgi:hypothetical protein
MLVHLDDSERDISSSQRVSRTLEQSGMIPRRVDSLRCGRDLNRTLILVS